MGFLWHHLDSHIEMFPSALQSSVVILSAIRGCYWIVPLPKQALRRPGCSDEFGAHRWQSQVVGASLNRKQNDTIFFVPCDRLDPEGLPI